MAEFPKNIQNFRNVILFGGILTIWLLMITWKFVGPSQPDFEVFRSRLKSLKSSRVRIGEFVFATADAEWSKEQIFNLNLSSKTMQNDTRIVEYIRRHHLVPPATPNEPIDVTVHPMNENIERQFGKLVFKFVIQLLKEQRGGFYIECGANDGQLLSNTLDLELKYDWEGLLVESDPVPLKRLLSRNRRAWIADVCLSTTPFPQQVEMQRHKDWEGVSFQTGFRPGNQDWSVRFNVSCFPLFSILSALNVSTVDYFSFDIEGAELAILKTVPFDAILFKVISIEVLPGNEGKVRNFMTSKGFRFVKLITEKYAHDYIFTHPTLQ